MHKLIQLLARALLAIFHQIKSFNAEVLRTPGPVLLVPNHLTWIDWLFLLPHLDKDWRFVTSSATAKTSWLHKLVMVNSHTFPIDPASPYAVKRMAEYLKAGGRLVLFAEGRMSRTGSLMKLYDGTGFLLHTTGARVITCFLRGAERVRWAKHPGWKFWFTPVSLHFSAALTPPPWPAGGSMAQTRTRVTNWLREEMVRQQFETEMAHGPQTVLEAVAHMAALRPGFTVLQDVSDQELSYRRLVMGTDVLAQVWRETLAGEDRVGVLLPNVNATPVTLLSLWAAGKTPAILNFSTGPTIMLACAQLAGLKKIITSRAFVEKARLKLDPLKAAGIEFLELETVRQQVPKAVRLRALAAHTLFPGAALRNPFTDPARTAVVLFTSGSEGVPKGVELTHTNLLANLRQMMAMVDIQDSDRFFTCLPLFHSFGLTVGTLMPLVRGVYCFLYPSPLHYRLVPVVCYERDCTILLATNTFLNGYARKAHPYDFRSVRYLFAGAEKIQEATATLFQQRFGVRILEGYGATECSPVISVNSPLSPHFGTTGQLMPGMEWRLEPVEGMEPATGGRLFVRGPNVMKGYLNPEANDAFKALDGWYDTGDIVQVSADKVVQILGRQKRFAKISGEMVSLTAVEDALAGAFPQYGLRCQVAMLSRPDPDKGEALVAVTNEARMTLEEIRTVLRGKGLPNLAAPKEILAVKEIPKLGTGKVNHRELQQLLKS
jgi:acyl-[acyl-carrier-protein]-phospholipid O-acyltransferase/long-chain-fatty-acid--[acyl-carrier-protein] ligase